MCFNEDCVCRTRELCADPKLNDIFFCCICLKLVCFNNWMQVKPKIKVLIKQINANYFLPHPKVPKMRDDILQKLHTQQLGDDIASPMLQMQKCNQIAERHERIHIANLTQSNRIVSRPTKTFILINLLQ